jgi:hypothetical protein
MSFVTVPNLFKEIVDFFQDIKAVQVPHLDNVYLPAPQDPRAHLVVYSTAMQFCLIWGIFLIAFLAARFFVHSPTRKKADNLGDIVFWLGAAYFSQIWLVDTTKWFEFWSVIIILIGVSLIVRAVFSAVAWKAPS